MPTIQFIPGFGQSVGIDGVALLDIRVNRIRNPNTDADIPAPGGIGGYDANMTFPGGSGNAVNILDMRGVAPFDTPITNLNNTTGSLNIMAFQMGSTPQAPVTLFQLAPRIIGSKNFSHTVSLTFDSLVDVNNGAAIPADSARTIVLRRGDARNDGVINVADALFIGQYLAAMREAGQTLAQTHIVNAASVKTDTSAGDKVTIADAMLIGQMLVGLRDDSFN